MRCKNVMQSKNTSIELYKIILNTYLNINDQLLNGNQEVVLLATLNEQVLTVD